MNSFTIIGRPTKDPEMRMTTSGKKVTNFTMAVNRAKGSNGQEDVDYVNCSAWEHNAEFADKYLRKGKRAYVRGRMQSRDYENREGIKIKTWDLIVEQMEPLEWEDKPKVDERAMDQYFPDEPDEEEDKPSMITSDDLPF